MEVRNGSYAITEQGDLGLGLTPIDESAIKEKENDRDVERKGDTEFFK